MHLARHVFGGPTHTYGPMPVLWMLSTGEHPTCRCPKGSDGCDVIPLYVLETIGFAGSWRNSQLGAVDYQYSVIGDSNVPRLVRRPG